MYDPSYKVKDFYSYLERAKTLYGDKALFRFNKKTEVVDVSYEEFFTLVNKMALAFQEIGIAGKKVILIGETSVQWIASYLATVIADGIIVPLDPNL
ncbi:MAG: AMP-binding protein, partial [Clostridia bacterium]|nr:AMP-binding protein [Clostridia bacterium]